MTGRPLKHTPDGSQPARALMPLRREALRQRVGDDGHQRQHDERADDDAVRQRREVEHALLVDHHEAAVQAPVDRADEDHQVDQRYLRREMQAHLLPAAQRHLLTLLVDDVDDSPDQEDRADDGSCSDDGGEDVEKRQPLILSGWWTGRSGVQGPGTFSRI